MIYISSACSKQKIISHAVSELVEQCFKNIELTGGTQYYENYERDLLELKEKHGLNFLIHNYFPPPEEPFILNLASLDKTIYEKSINHLKKALDLTRLLGGNKFGFHAGFFVDRPVEEIGKKFGRSELYDREKALKNFTDGFCRLKDEFKDIDLYIENNCYSASNYQVYGSIAPFMLLNFQDYEKLQNKIGFKLLLDIGHLMVSAGTLDIDFKREFQDMFKISDYIHISSNDSKHDQHLGLEKKSQLVEILNSCDWKNKTVSLEINQSHNGLIDGLIDDLIDGLIDTYSIVSLFKNI